MTLAEIRSAIAAVEQRFNERTEMWRIVVASNGAIVRRVYVGSFINVHREPSGESPEENNT
jgi:hypothetical protein